MSLNDKSLTLSLLSDPINVQKIVLDDVFDRYNNNYTIVDPNNVALHLIEMTSTLTANFAFAEEQAFNSTNALRAQTTEDLAKNMSDYDYVNQYSTPATTTIVMTLDKVYLEENALDYNENYKKVIIPKDTIFTISNLTFGIYYPIEIRINKTTGTPLVVFDTSSDNPLHSLKQNIIPFTEQEVLKMKLLILKIPVYQFSRSIIVEDLIPEKGFAKKYSFTDKFYAVRLFTEKNNKTIELHQTLSQNSYDPYDPTARLQIDPMSNKFSINIPQVYFTSKQMGAKLTLEVFTSKGALDIDISSLAAESIKVNFNLSKNSNEFSKILSMIPTILVAPATDKIVGGSNGYTFEEMRTRVINNAFHTSVLVTPMDFEKYFSDTGFKILRYKDDLTNLTYFGYRELTDKSGSIVPAMTSYIDLRESFVNTVSTILKNLDDTYTILPKTLYKYNHSSQACIPVDDVVLQQFSQMSKLELIEEFNSELYTRSPFHIRLIPDGRYPKVASYNLLNPILSDLLFEKENPNITAQMVATAGAVYHQNEGSGGYRVQFMITKSSDLLELPEEDIYIHMYTQASDGMFVGTRLQLVNKLDNNFIYECILDTDYCISRDHTLNITTLKDDTTEWDHFVPLTNEYHLVFLVKSDHFPLAITESSLYTGVDTATRMNHLVMLRQKCTISLGYSLEDVIYNNINLQWSGKRYATHPIDVIMTYPYDVYETDENNIPVIQLDNETCKATLNPTHLKGDPIYDDTGMPVYKHRAGDVVYDSFGEPVVTEDRVIIYYINALMFDAKLYLSEHPTQLEYRNNLPATLENYFTTLRNASELLLERDLLYFRPIRTMGNSQFNIGDSVIITMPLNMKFKLRCHVNSAIVNDAVLREAIELSIIDLIEPEISNPSISLTEIAKYIKSKVDYIESIDVLGINGDTTLQTLKIVDESVRPSISQELYLTKNNLLAIRKSVEIEFVTI